MFDPSIYENLKVVIEGSIYDLDLAGEIVVTSRKDLVDLASLSRTFSIGFQLADSNRVSGELMLHTTLTDFSLEKIKGNETQAGCEIHVYIHTPIVSVEKCQGNLEVLKKIWDNRPTIVQRISYVYGQKDTKNLEVRLGFERKINEDHVGDLLKIIDLTVTSLRSF